MNNDIIKNYLRTSVYTYAGLYRSYFQSLPDDIPAIGKLVCDAVTHPTMYFLPPSPYLEDTYFGKFSEYSKHRLKNEDELFLTAAGMIAEIFRLDPAGLRAGKHVNQRITVSCRSASILFSAILKAKGIPCRSRAGFMDFGNDGNCYTEHWVNEYWNFQENRWVLVDADGYYEYETRFDYTQYDLPRRKFVPAAEAWLSIRKGGYNKQLDVIASDIRSGVCAYLFMDFHALMNQEIFYSHQPLFLRNGLDALQPQKLEEIDTLAQLMLEPDIHMAELESLYTNCENYFILTNATQNEYIDAFTDYT